MLDVHLGAGDGARHLLDLVGEVVGALDVDLELDHGELAALDLLDADVLGLGRALEQVTDQVLEVAHAVHAGHAAALFALVLGANADVAARHQQGAQFLDVDVPGRAGFDGLLGEQAGEVHVEFDALEQLGLALALVVGLDVFALLGVPLERDGLALELARAAGRLLHATLGHLGHLDVEARGAAETVEGAAQLARAAVGEGHDRVGDIDLGLVGHVHVHLEVHGQGLTVHGHVHLVQRHVLLDDPAAAQLGSGGRAVGQRVARGDRGAEERGGQGREDERAGAVHGDEVSRPWVTVARGWREPLPPGWGEDRLVGRVWGLQLPGQRRWAARPPASGRRHGCREGAEGARRGGKIGVWADFARPGPHSGARRFSAIPVGCASRGGRSVRTRSTPAALPRRTRR